MQNEITTLILAAGFSTRMKKFKPLAIYNGKTFIENIVRKTEVFSKEIVIVTGYKKEELIEEIEKLPQSFRRKIKTVFNRNYAEGMFSSVKTGLSEVKTKWVLLHFVDQPSLPEDFYFELLNEISEKYDWIQPSYSGKKAHPLLLKQKAITQITETRKVETLKEISELIENKRIYETKYKQTTDNFNKTDEIK